MIAQEELYALLRSDLFSFVQKAWPILDGSAPNFDAPYIGYLCAGLQQFTENEETRLAIFAPPRHGKSIITSMIWPAWLLGRNPSLRIIGLGHDAKLPGKMHGGFRRVIEHNIMRETFPAFVPTKLTAEEVETSAGGFHEARSLSSAMTGSGGDLFIVDDPISYNDSKSVGAREKCLADFQYLITRQDQPKTTKIVLLMQRLHFDDLGAYVKELAK
jgi:hypothetical protein